MVADTINNKRSNILMWERGSASPAEKEDALGLAMLSTDPYGQMGMILHEAFHVQQAKWGLGKAGDESALLTYPCLSVTNNVGFALEARELTTALTATDEEEIWLAALRWLAIRSHRREELPTSSIAYEDGTEFNEGLATYVEWRLTHAIEGREPAPAMAWVRGFHGYDDMSFQRAELLESMRGFLTGERVVNDDPYGTAPVRFRLYWSGMAIGAMLDAIHPEWKERMMQSGTTLTGLVKEALLATPEDLELALEEVMAEPGCDPLVAAQTKLREEGERVAREKCEAILNGEGTLLLLDHSALTGMSAAFSFTPFGITRVDENRTIYEMVPIGVRIGQGNVVRQTRAVPLLHDAGASTACFRLDEEVTDEALAAAMGVERLTGEVLGEISFELPGVSIEVQEAVVRRAGGSIVIELR